MAKILDACCGSRMFWYDKQNQDVTFMDNRKYYEELKSGHVVNVNPDVLADFRDMPFEDEYFDSVVFDPPHLLNAGQNSWLRKKYGVLNKETWPTDLKQGFDECIRVLKTNGTLIFKWNSQDIPTSKVLKIFEKEPLFGDQRGKTRWIVFMK